MATEITIKYADSCNKLNRIHEFFGFQPHTYHPEDKTVTIKLYSDTYRACKFLASSLEQKRAYVEKTGNPTDETYIEELTRNVENWLYNDSLYGRVYKKEISNEVLKNLVEIFVKQGIHY